MRQSSQTRTGVSQPLLGTGRLVAEQELHTPWPHWRQWCTRLLSSEPGPWLTELRLGPMSLSHTAHELISLSGTQ